MKRYTIDEFKVEFATDDLCLDYLFDMRYKNIVCPKCECDKPFNRVKNRRSYRCPDCSYQLYPTKDTVFEKTTTPLTYWFLAIFMQTTTRNGVAAKELQRVMDISYPTALRMCHQIKILIGKKKFKINSKGVVQIDESWLGQRFGNMHNKKRKEIREAGDTHLDNKVGVMGFISEDKEIKFEVLDNSKTYIERVKDNVSKDATIVTDSHISYSGLNLHFVKHEVVNHLQNEFVKNGYHTNGIENVWSIVKRTIKGTHIHVSRAHLPKYLDEIAFRMMYKDRQDEMFKAILSHVVL